MRTTTIHVGPGSIVRLGNEVYCVKRWETSDSVLARGTHDLKDRVIPLAEITESLPSNDDEQIDLFSIDEEAWDEAVEKYRALRHLVHDAARKAQDVTNVASDLGVSMMTVYRWIKRIERSGTVTCLLRKRRTDAGKRRLPEAVEKIVQDVIAEEYLTSLKKSPTKILNEVRRRCRNAELEAPSKTVIVSRIEAISPEEKVRKRQGRNAALNFRAARGSAPGIDHVHSVWQIDHTKVDEMLVDEKDRIAIGRPWITVAIDVWSRMVVGWYVSFDPPGALGTGICIVNAILPKDSFLAKLGVEFSWPCQGKPAVIHADNAKEFRGEMLQVACSEHGFDLSFRKVKKPNYGAHIERLLGTLLGEIHGLAGSTFSSPEQKGEYDSAGEATMTLDEFERWLANLILGKYHNRKHSELNCSPIKKYNDGILGNDDMPGIGVMPIAADPDKLRIDFMPLEHRTIQAYGLVLDNIEYHSPVLDRWIGATEPSSKRNARKFIFRRDPRNISFLYFWDPDLRRYFTIPYRDTSLPAISLWELRAIRHFLNERGKQDVNEKEIFTALNEMRRIETESKSLTRSKRLEQERRRRHRLQVPTPPRPAEETVEAEEPSKKFDPSTMKRFTEIERL